jgi:hypothetical protein
MIAQLEVQAGGQLMGRVTMAPTSFQASKQVVTRSLVRALICSHTRARSQHLASNRPAVETRVGLSVCQDRPSKGSKASLSDSMLPDADLHRCKILGPEHIY